MKRFTTYDPTPPPLRFLGDPERPRADYAVAARAALAVGAFVTMILWSIEGLLFYVFDSLLKYWIGFILFAVVVGMISGGTYGVIWIITAVTRAWKVDDEERYRRYSIEDEQRAQAQTTEAPVPTRADRINEAVRMILDRHYLDKQKTDRDTMVAAEMLSQPEWNEAQALLKIAKIKNAKGFIFESYPEAVAAYRTSVKITSGVFWTTSDDGKTWQRFDY